MADAKDLWHQNDFVRSIIRRQQRMLEGFIEDAIAQAYLEAEQKSIVDPTEFELVIDFNQRLDKAMTNYVVKYLKEIGWNNINVTSGADDGFTTVKVKIDAEYLEQYSQGLPEDGTASDEEAN